jgi:hypothetical protein
MKRRPVDEDNGFGEHGGYMNAKINKLEEQFSTLQKEVQKSNLFEGERASDSYRDSLFHIAKLNYIFRIRHIDLCQWPHKPVGR